MNTVQRTNKNRSANVRQDGSFSVLLKRREKAYFKTF